MKYHRLSQDQLNSVYKQFIFYLRSKGIDKKLWSIIKKKESRKMDLLLDEFSEMVWDKIMSECSFFNYSDKDQLFLFNSKKNLFRL